MTRLGSLVFCAMSVMGIAFHGCGGGSSGGGTGGSGAGGAVGTGGAAGGTGAGGAGAGGTDVVLGIIPASGAISGWTVDTAFNASTTGWPSDTSKPAVATNLKDATDLIDGGAAGFFNSAQGLAPNVFVWQNYINNTTNPPLSPGGYQLALYVMQMPSVAQATTLYTSLLDGTHSLYSTNTWTDMSPAVGDKARITNSGTDWWINFRKGAYYCQVRLTYAESTDLDGKQATIDFATAVALKM